MYLVCEEGYDYVQKLPSQHYFTCTHLDTRMKIINPLSPKCDQHPISPCNINALYNTVVMRITDMITQDEFA